MRKLCLAFSAFAALVFSSTVKAQSVGEIIQSPNGDYKAYEVVDGINLFEGTIDCTFEELASKGEIKGWYGGPNWVQAVEGSNSMYVSTQEYKEGVRGLKITTGSSNLSTSLRTFFKITESGLYLFRGWTKIPSMDPGNRQYNTLGLANTPKTLGDTKYTLNVYNGTNWCQSFYAFNVEATADAPKYLTVKFAFTNTAYVDAFSLIKVKEVPNKPLLLQTISDVDADLGGRDNADAVIKVRLKNAEALYENEYATIEDVYNTIIDLEKIDVSFNNTLKAFREQLAVAEELGVDVEVYNQKLLDNASTITASEINGMLSNDLNVDEFNAVKNNYTCNYPLGEWVKENVGEASNEHWSGESVKYMYTWHAWNATSNVKLNVKQTVTLPAGEYVLKAAGYTNVAAVSPFVMSVKDKSVVFPQKGRTGYGIDVSGDANFSPEGVYANSGNGRGWEWRFIPFKLETTETLEFSFNAELAKNTWAGIGDIQLLGKAYYRDVTSGDYGTICLPYDVDMASVSGVEKVYKVSSMTSELATLTPVEAMEAGKPYIFKSNAAEVVMPAKVGGTVVGTPQEDTYLVGTFADIDKMDYGTYVLSGNKFCKVVEGNEGDAVTLGAYRCYFQPLTNGVKNFGFVEDGGETTGINNVENEVDMKNAVIYDLTGRRVTSPVKGIYIVNGKKMVVDNLK